MENGKQNIPRSTLRKVLNFVLRTGPELDAFCLDYFPQVQQRFSSSMDRLVKVNLLLESVADGVEILEGLRDFMPKLTMQCINSLGVKLPEKECNDSALDYTLHEFEKTFPLHRWRDLPISILVLSDLARSDRNLLQTNLIKLRPHRCIDSVMREICPSITLKIFFCTFTAKESISIKLIFQSLADFGIDNLIEVIPQLKNLANRRRALLKTLRDAESVQVRGNLDSAISYIRCHASEFDDITDFCDFSRTRLDGISRKLATQFCDSNNFSSLNKSDFTLAIDTLLLFAIAFPRLEKFIHENSVSLISRVLDNLTDCMDQTIASIIYSTEYRVCEQSWFTTEYLISRISNNNPTQIAMLDATKEMLDHDFNGSLTNSRLYQIMTSQAFGPAASPPFTIILANFFWDNNMRDQELIGKLSDLAMSTSTILLTNIGPEFFGVDKYDYLSDKQELGSLFKHAKYTIWNSFRQLPAARHGCLVLPRIMLRAEDSAQQRSSEYSYEYSGQTILLGGGATLLALQVAHSCNENANPFTIQCTAEGLFFKKSNQLEGKKEPYATDWMFPDTRSAELNRLGFTAICALKNSMDRVRINRLVSAYDFAGAGENSIKDITEPSIRTILIGCHFANCIKYLYRNRGIGIRDKGMLKQYLCLWLEKQMRPENDDNLKFLQARAEYPMTQGTIEIEDYQEHGFKYIVIMKMLLDSDSVQSEIPLRMLVNL